MCAFLAGGCDREMAARLTRTTLEQLHQTMCRDAAFASEVRYAEATAELMHLRKLQKATEDPKQWRASALWLERHAPERFGPRPAGTLTKQQLKAFVAYLAQVVEQTVRNLVDRNQLVSHLGQIVCELDAVILNHAGDFEPIQSVGSTPTLTTAPVAPAISGNPDE